jgi:NTP pyrophosphatase (non-canonical NTP hydrolase)
MKANEYQALAERTLIASPDFQITPDQVMLVWNAIGLAGEAGEVAELAKKQIFHQQGLDVEKWKKELGDVLWYVAACCTRLGLSLEDVMQHNVDKLRARYPKGYTPQRSTFRDGAAE